MTTSRTISAILLATVLAACGGQPATLTAPRIVAFSATPETLTTTGGDTTLSWEVRGAATELAITPGVGRVSGSGIRVSPDVTTTYTLTASNALGSHSAKTTVRVPVAEAPDPGASGGPNRTLAGAWVFEIVGDEGTRVSGEVYLDADFVYEGAAGLWGSVSECRGQKDFCERAPLGGLVHEPDTDVYSFGLGSMDGALAFIGRDEDGELAENAPLHFMLEGRGTVGEGEPAAFVAYQLGK